ncbi:MAG: transposase [Chloroflexota bacterium]|nr:transposase [Chloroflexota bacterium]
MPAEHSWEEGQYAIITQFVKEVSPHLGQTQCRLLADSGISREKLVQLCEEAGWHYLLRIELDKGYYATELDAQGQPLWQPLKTILSEPGQDWQGRVWLWKTHQRQTWLTATWQVGQDAPLVVISDEGAGRHYLCRYRGRMRVEAMFQDKKSRGFGLQATHVRSRVHLDRLLLLLCLAIWWLARLGAACIHHGQRWHFDRGDRRDKSVIRLGRQWFLEIVERARSHASLARCLPFHRHQHGWRLCLRF